MTKIWLFLKLILFIIKYIIGRFFAFISTTFFRWFYWSFVFFMKKVSANEFDVNKWLNGNKIIDWPSKLIILFSTYLKIDIPKNTTKSIEWILLLFCGCIYDIFYKNLHVDQYHQSDVTAFYEYWTFWFISSNEFQCFCVCVCMCVSLAMPLVFHAMKSSSHLTSMFDDCWQYHWFVYYEFECIFQTHCQMQLQWFARRDKMSVHKMILKS